MKKKCNLISTPSKCFIRDTVFSGLFDKIHKRKNRKKKQNILNKRDSKITQNMFELIFETVIPCTIAFFLLVPPPAQIPLIGFCPRLRVPTVVFCI